MAGAAPGERSLADTPTWAVALVCLVMVILSMMMEHGLHLLSHFFHKRHKKAMHEALEKIKAELMLLGFISLLLTVGQQPISNICIPAKAAGAMLPCKKNTDKADDENSNQGRRKLLSFEEEKIWRRVLAATTNSSCSGVDKCFPQNSYQEYRVLVSLVRKGALILFIDKVPLISQSGIHQLHIFIFILAVLHVLYSVLTMVLGKAKMKRWKAWEAETVSLEYQFSNDPSRFRFTHQTSFVKRHVGLSSTPGIRWIVAFLRQFFGSITKVDYLTMRHGFINAHLSPNSKFDFHKYIKRSLEDDFKVVVGISFPLWLMAIIILLIDINGWNTLIWVSFVPLIVLLLVGMKLEIIIMEMARQIEDRTTVTKGVPIVEPSNKYFWFNRPQWILFLIHLTLFENAFQVAHFLWIWYSFGLKSCFHNNLPLTIVKIVMGLALQFMCSYITFPLYALVTQMGSHMKKSIFEEQTAKALQKWRKAAKDRKKARDASVSSGFMSGENTPSQASSPIHLLHKYKSNSDDIESFSSSPPPKFQQLDNDISAMEAPTFGNKEYHELIQPFPKPKTNYAHDEFTFNSTER